MSGTTIQSLARGLRILEVIAVTDQVGSLAKISRELKLNRSTAHHLLRTLAAHGYVVQDGVTRVYRLGPKIQRLASATWSAGQIAEIAQPYMQDLVRRTGESVSLAIRKHDQAILIKTVDGKGTLRVVDNVGTARPIHCSAVGKVLVVWAPESERDAIVASLQFKSYAPRTIVSRGRFRKELTKVRQLGYALDDEEMARGVRCIAAPVFLAPGQAFAAVGVSGPAARISRKMLSALAKPLAITVRQLAERMASLRGA